MRTVQFSSVMLAASISTGLALSNNLITIPQGTGPYAVSYQNLELVDTSRRDPFNTSQPRRLAISRFDPVPKASCNETSKSQYMTPLVAKALFNVLPSTNLPSNFFQQFELETCTNTPEPLSKSKFPVALFGQGAGGVRSAYSAFVQQIASYGYTIFSVDFPGNAAVVEYDNGDVQYRGNYTELNFTSAIVQDIQQKDFSFILTALGFSANSTGEGSKAVAFGHSFGGATSAATVAYDSRFAGGVNIDGSIWGETATATLGQGGNRQTFLLWSSSPGTGGAAGLEDWKTFKAAQVGAKDSNFLGELRLGNTTHYSYDDVPLLVDLAGLRDSLSPPIVGNITGKRLFEVFGYYMPNLFDIALGRGGDEQIFKQSPPGYEDVEVIR